MKTIKMNKTGDMFAFATKDLYEASFLYAKGQRLIRLEKDGSTAWFIFEDQKSCENLSQSFWGKEASVNAKEYAEAIRSLKDRIFSQR